MQLYPSLYPNFCLGRGRCNQHLPSRVLTTFYRLVFYWLYGLFVIMSELGKNQISVVCSSISRLLQEKPVNKRPAHFFSSRLFLASLLARLVSCFAELLPCSLHLLSPLCAKGLVKNSIIALIHYSGVHLSFSVLFGFDQLLLSIFQPLH